jgi:hypothetical protein
VYWQAGYNPNINQKTGAAIINRRALFLSTSPTVIKACWLWHALLWQHQLLS